MHALQTRGWRAIYAAFARLIFWFVIIQSTAIYPRNGTLARPDSAGIVRPREPFLNSLAVDF